MPSQLETFLSSLSPVRTWDEVDQQVARVRSALALPATIASATELRAVLTQAWREFHGRVWGLGTAVPSLNARLEWDFATRILDEVFGKPNGWQTALDLARTGVDGGLPGVVVAFLDEAAEQYMSHLIEASIHQFWHLRPVDEQLEMVAQYRSLYGQYLPESLRDGSPFDLLLIFPRVLTEHPRMLRRLRRLGPH
jgi:hypothetical protein